VAEQEADRLGLRHDVRFVGKVENVADLLRGGDLFLLPSQTESFGLAALEAMACGLPVVASRVGGVPEVVVDGESGALCELGDVAGMTARALEVLRDPDRLTAMRAAAVHRAGAFASDKVVPRYERLYADVLGR